jgi:hypothetical protein
MQKTLRSFLFILLAFSSGSYAQAQCTPDLSITQQGLYPDSATGLPHAYVGVPYNTVIQIRVLTDTTYLGLPAKIDSVRIDSIRGLPLTGGFAYQCNKSSCTWAGGTNGCVLLTGNPTQAGTYPVKIYLKAYGKASGFPATLPSTINYYKIVVEQNTGIQSLNPNEFGATQNSPNPFSGISEITFNVPHAGKISFTVYNLLGMSVYSHSVNASAGINKIAISSKELGQGVYMYSLSDGRTTITKKMVVSGK